MRERTEEERNHLLDHARRLEEAAEIIRTAVSREDRTTETWTTMWRLISPVGIFVWSEDDFVAPLAFTPMPTREGCSDALLKARDAP